jgi:hypothetical protein
MEDMGIASGLANRIVRIADSSRPWIAVVLLAAALCAGMMIGEHLLPASEPLIAAPLRW